MLKKGLTCRLVGGKSSGVESARYDDLIRARVQKRNNDAICEHPKLLNHKAGFEEVPNLLGTDPFQLHICDFGCRIMRKRAVTRDFLKPKPHRRLNPPTVQAHQGPPPERLSTFQKVSEMQVLNLNSLPLLLFTFRCLRFDCLKV